MSAASSPVRRPAAAPQVVNAPARSPQRTSAAASGSEQGDYLVNLSDIPPLDTNLDIEGLKPTLLSRLFDLFSPKRS